MKTGTKIRSREAQTLSQTAAKNSREKFDWLRDIQSLSTSELIEVYAYAEAIVETVREPLLVLEKNLQVRSANKAFFDTFKMTEQETIGKHVYDLNGGEWNIPALKKLLETILPRNSHFNDFEVTHNFDRLGQKTMLLNARRIVLKKNKTQLILLAIEDITERKQAQGFKDELISIVSHELRTPLTAIKFFLEIVQGQLHKQGDLENYHLITKARKLTEKLNTLINQMLIAGRIEAGKASLVKKKVDLDALIKNVIEDYQHTTENHTIIQEGEVGVKVECDEHRLEQVLTNLITNAIKYSPQAGQIIVKAARKENEAVISVQDFGLGIVEKDLPKMFQKFYRTIEENKARIQGFGLGLYISAQIVERHKGRIWVESKKGKGSTFTFALPIS